MAPPAGWPAALTYQTLRAARHASELALFDAPSRTLVLTDLAFNIGRHARALDAAAWSLFGVPSDFGPARTSRVFLLGDETTVPSFLARVLSWPFERIVVAHGQVIDGEARARFERAFARYLTGGIEHRR
jgi:hypothetical protein